MNNAFDELTTAIEAAKQVRRACDNNANAMAELLLGSLRNVSRWKLERLKRELRDFNIHTGRWK